MNAFQRLEVNIIKEHDLFAQRPHLLQLLGSLTSFILLDADSFHKRMMILYYKELLLGNSMHGKLLVALKPLQLDLRNELILLGS